MGKVQSDFLCKAWEVLFPEWQVALLLGRHSVCGYLDRPVSSTVHQKIHLDFSRVSII